MLLYHIGGIEAFYKLPRKAIFDDQMMISHALRKRRERRPPTNACVEHTNKVFLIFKND